MGYCACWGLKAVCATSGGPTVPASRRFGRANRKVLQLCGWFIVLSRLTTPGWKGEAIRIEAGVWTFILRWTSGQHLMTGTTIWCSTGMRVFCCWWRNDAWKTSFLMFFKIMIICLFMCFQYCFANKYACYMLLPQKYIVPTVTYSKKLWIQKLFVCVLACWCTKSCM